MTHGTAAAKRPSITGERSKRMAFYSGYPGGGYYQPPTNPPIPDQLTQFRQGFGYQSTAMTQAPQQPSMIWIPGQSAVSSYPVANGCSVPLWDMENSVIYIKSVDMSGVPSVRTLDYTERPTQSKTPLQQVQPQPTADYVTRDDFNALVARVDAMAKKPNRKKEDAADEQPAV